MNYTLFVCMNEDNIQKFIEEKIVYDKFMFSVGLDCSFKCYINDLLGIDYNSFGQGIKIFLEDNERKASDILKPLHNLKKFEDNIFYDLSSNIIVINYFKTNKDSVKNFVQKIFNLVYKINIIKVFNVSKQNLKNYLLALQHKNNFFDYKIFENCLDSAILIRFINDVELEKQEKILQTLTKDLEKFYYADRDITLSNAVFEILTVQKLKIATTESFTSGLLANTIIRENPGASAVIEQSYITYSDNIKHKILNVDNETLKKFTAVSAETAFEMATGLLDITDANIVIATTGYANHENSELSGLFYTAIGDDLAVNVYKHKFSGNRQSTIQYGVNVALFETIKKLRQNTLKNINFVV